MRISFSLIWWENIVEINSQIYSIIRIFKIKRGQPFPWDGGFAFAFAAGGTPSSR